MERALAVVDGEESTKELLREAGEIATGVSAELVLLHVTSEEEFAQRRMHHLSAKGVRVRETNVEGEGSTEYE